MGTLTAGQPRLAEYCDHKLPTSCRLTSIPECCACADERAHSSAYSVYIDGVGFVQRGTRWQRYCWFCKEFWENRVRASGLRPAQTRIPEVPVQEAFLDRWYEFHRGYRTVTKEDGSEERVAVLGEALREVSPGYLPRTLEELRTGRAANHTPEQPQQHVDSHEQEEGEPSLEDTLDQLFQAASVEDVEQPQPIPVENVTTDRGEIVNTDQTTRQRSGHHMPEDGTTNGIGDAIALRGRDAMQGGEVATRPSVHAQAMAPMASRNREYQSRRVAALRRELHRMRNGIERVISGLRDLGENVPDHTEASGRLADLARTLDVIDGAPSREHAERAINGVNALTHSSTTTQSDRTLANIQRRLDEARQHVDEARRNRDQAASELDLAEQEFRTSQHRHQHLQREQRTTENHLRLFGTREEMIAQGDQYESPIGSMFTRAQERFRAAEEVRVEERTLRRVLQDEASAGGEEGARQLAELANRQTDVWGVPTRSRLLTQDAPALEAEETTPQEPRGELEEYYALLRRQDGSQRAPQAASQGRAITPATPVSSAPDTSTVPTDSFPQNMLSALVAARESNSGRTGDLGSASEQTAELPPTEPTSNTVLTADEEWYADAEHVLLYFAENPERSMEYMITPDYLAALLSRVTERSFTANEQRELGGLLDTSDIIWSSRLPAARILRLRRAGVPSYFLPIVANPDIRARSHNTEVMAEVFQRSAELRRSIPLNAPEQLRILYRLQAGERTVSDVRMLEAMQADPEIFQLASRLLDAMIDDEHEGFHATRESLEEQRRTLARTGDHSRQELDAQRRAARDLAVAAGRTAMRAGPTALLERLANSDEETRAAYNRLQANGYAPEGYTPAERQLRETIYRPLDLTEYGDIASPSESESEADEDEAQGLDAKESGRPEQKTDEEMTVSMECRICYTQLAEIACLPCGHLVMCKWCSEQHSPVMAHDRTRPRRAAGCPVCRKGIRQKVRVFRA